MCMVIARVIDSIFGEYTIYGMVCKAPSVCLFYGGLGACPQQKIFEN